MARSTSIGKKILVEYADYNVKEKSLVEYRNNIFIINILREKVFIVRGIISRVTLLKTKSEKLQEHIKNYLQQI